MTQATLSLIILLATAVLMVVDIIPTSVVAIIGALACGFTGLIDKSELLATLGTETMITLIGLSIVGSAMFKTGLANRMARSILKVSGKNENGVYIASMVIGTLLSAVASNTAVVITMIPLIMSMCQKVKVSPSRILYPMVAACSFGSALTLIGTPSNIAGNSVLAKFGLPSMGFFDVAWVGVPLTVVGFIYMMTLGKKTLPKDEYVEDETAIQDLDAIEPWNKKAVLTAVICAVTLVTSLDKGTQPFVVCDG